MNGIIVDGVYLTKEEINKATTVAIIMAIEPEEVLGKVVAKKRREKLKEKTA